MFKVFIRGLKDGQFPIDLSTKASDIQYICPEFANSEIKVSGNLKVFGNRFTIEINAQAEANLICDLSLEEYKEVFDIPIVLSYIADAELYDLNQNDNDFNMEEIIIHPDDKEIDFTNDVREILCLNLPMKRVSPKYRGTDFSEIHPELNKQENNSSIDDRWEKLKNIKLN